MEPQTMTVNFTTLEEYLAENLDRAEHVIDHLVRANRNAETGEVTFYIHPSRADGKTLDFSVKGNTLTCTTKILAPTPPADEVPEEGNSEASAPPAASESIADGVDAAPTAVAEPATDELPI